MLTPQPGPPVLLRAAGAADPAGPPLWASLRCFSQFGALFPTADVALTGAGPRNPEA